MMEQLSKEKGGIPTGKPQIEIFLLDNDPRSRELCTLLFSPMGYLIHAFDSISEALACGKELSPKVLISELGVGGEDGLFAVERLKQLIPHLSTIILTEEPSAASAVRAIRLGVDDYIIKHGDSTAHLKRAVRDSMRKHAQHAEVERLLKQVTALNESFMEKVLSLQQTNSKLKRLEPHPIEEDWRILIIDDDQSIVALLETLLSSQGYQVDGAYSGTEARSLFQTRHYDLVITDKNLGDADGIDLIQEIRSLDKETEVLLMTGFATLESAVDAVNYGAVGYLCKPFEQLSVVLDRVNTILGRVKEKHDQLCYQSAFRERHASFFSQYRLLKLKLETLKREPL